MSSELSGIVVVDKPEGVSSAGVVARVKKLFGARKTGHAGTLDPFATGVLVCCLNQATRLARFMLKGDKRYTASMVLGADTDTQDATGTVVEQRPWEGIEPEAIFAAAKTFVGEIEQIPPVYSALKHKGTPLYKLARRGEAVEKPARKVRVDRMEILSIDLPDVRLAVSCSSGTYVRTLCADMGSILGCGGHLKRLRRDESSGFGIEDAWQLEQLTELEREGRLEQTVIPMNTAMPSMPQVVAGDGLADKVRHGVPLLADDFVERPRVSDGGFFKVVDRNKRLLAVMSDAQPPGSYNYCCVFSV